MLSIENLPPADPLSCSSDSETSQSKLKTCHHLEADLRKSGLDYNTPFPNFSIRDYVFNARAKNIKNHWPFSPHNLQLCLKHGVKDILPPFDSIINLPQSSAEKPETLAIQASNKVENHSQTLVKKSQLVLKLSVNASETMASKVCPVCKTFSSSSNTTLNAHIDQCLSGESTIKRTANLKAVKHNIKPRRTRLMVNIYATALHCTLEDLNRRNGTNWASNLDMPMQDDTEVYAEEKNCMSSPLNDDDKNDEGTIYFDSNGKKLRILSKFDDQEKNLKGDEFRARSPVEVSKHLSIKKKRHVVHRHKLQKWPDNCPEVVRARDREFLPQPSNDCCQMKSDDFGKIKTWKGSKRTGLKKKTNVEHENQHADKIAKDVRRLNRHLPSLVEKLVKSKYDLNFKRKENLSVTPKDDYMERPCLRKQDEFSLLASQDRRGKNNHPIVSKCDVSSRKDGSSVRKHCTTDSSIGTESHASSLSSKKLRRISSSGKDDGSFIGSRISQHDIVSSEGEKFGSLKRVSSVNRSDDEGIGAAVSTGNEGDTASNSHAGVDMIGSFEAGDVAAGASNVCEPTSVLSACMTFGDSLDSRTPGLEGLPDPKMNSHNYVKAYQEHCLNDLASVEQENYCVDKVGKGSYFVDVDPISIPGPPGSFLPSPRCMGSEELQGNSSLTTCRIYSSEDEHVDSSNSPVSATSNPQKEPMPEAKTEVANSDAKFPTYGDRDSPSPSSTCSSVLRLMGKNLMVVNQEESRPPQTQSSKLSTFHNASSQMCSVVQHHDFCSSKGSSKSFGEGVEWREYAEQYSVINNRVLGAQAKEIIVIENSADNARGLSINNNEVGGSSVHMGYDYQTYGSKVVHQMHPRGPDFATSLASGGAFSFMSWGNFT